MPDILCNKPPSFCGNDPSNPFSNLSAEAPDEDVFIGRNWGPQTPNQPPLGSEWTQASCLGICYSTVSQADADLCASRVAVFCNRGNWTWPPNGGECPDGTVFNSSTGLCEIPVFCNTAQTCLSDCPDGSQFAFTQAAGAFCGYNNQQMADVMALSFACAEAAMRRVCLSDLNPPESCIDSEYSAGIIFSGSQPATLTIVSGILPPGIVANQADSTSPLLLTGTPTVDGDFTFTVRAETAAIDFMEKTYTLSVVTILNSALTEAVTNEPYSFSLTISGTQTGTVTWSLISGTLPDGLTLDPATGTISGTPTASGDYEFRVGFSDDFVTLCAKDLTLTVGGFAWDLTWALFSDFQLGAGGTHIFSGLPASSDLSVTNNPFGDVSVTYEGTQVVTLTSPVNCRVTLNGLAGDTSCDCQCNVAAGPDLLVEQFMGLGGSWTNAQFDFTLPAGTYTISIGVRAIALHLGEANVATSQFAAALTVLP